MNLFRRLQQQVDTDVLGSDDDAGTPSRSDGRLVQRRLATRPATPSTPQVCRRDARRRLARRAPSTSSVRDRHRDVGQSADHANDVDDVGLRRRTTNQRRQLPTCRSSLVATRSQRVFRCGQHERRGAPSGRRDAGVITLATAPCGASPRASRRQSRRTRCMGTVDRH